MDFEIKYKSITWRWLSNVFAPIAVCMTVVAITACLFVRSYYINSVRNAAEEYANGFMLLSSVDEAYFVSGARDYCEQFKYKDKIEVMIIDKNGNVVVSTTGFDRSDVKMPDYNKALVSPVKKAIWLGKSSAGERVLAGTEILKDYGSGSNGAVRYVVSMTSCYSRIWTMAGIIALVALGIMGFSALSGFFFIKSIARPVREVSQAARKIALGDYRDELKTDRVDEIGELCDSINYMEAELKNAEQLKNDFISSVSHELRTPLTAIRGWGETAKMSLGYDEELVSRGIDVVISEADRLSGLVEDMLDFSRMQSGRFSYELRPINIGVILKEAADMYTELAQKKEIELSVTLPKADAVVNGDSDRLKQVFINIIDNAVKYTNEKGQVLIEQTTEDACVKITVKDTGVGVPAQDIDRVKEKFYKANKEVRGSGIGLAVADEIVKQHGGLLFLESTEGIGTTVTIVLPVYEVKEEPIEKVITPLGEELISEQE